MTCPELHVSTEAPSQHAQNIADALDSWLAEECLSASTSHNKILDDVEKARSNLSMPLDDPNNWYVAKHKSHQNRQQKQFRELYEADIKNDYSSALSLFNVTMGMSGTARHMIALRSSSQNLYDKSRYDSSPSGINLAEAVDARLRFRLGGEITQENIENCNIDLEEVLTNIERAFDLIEECFGFVYLRSPDDFDKPISESGAILDLCQSIWTEAAVDAILFAAKVRGGDITKVPLLEPKSITQEPAVIYPFSTS